jgi:hypothetical protein
MDTQQIGKRANRQKGKSAKEQISKFSDLLKLASVEQGWIGRRFCILFHNLLRGICS